MLKYANVQVVFQEFPGETTLAINITGCPNHCPGCHSPHLWEDTGIPLTTESLGLLLKPYRGSGTVTCVGFMGGDQDCGKVQELARWVKEQYPHLKVGWYSGRNFWSDEIMQGFDYVKFGSYKKDLGGLDIPTTNQVMYKYIPIVNMWLNITKYFQLKPTDKSRDIYSMDIVKYLSMLHNVSSQTMLYQGVGCTVDGYETKIEQNSLENYIRAMIMALNGQVPPRELLDQHYRRKWGSDDEWENVTPYPPNHIINDQ